MDKDISLAKKDKTSSLKMCHISAKDIKNSILPSNERKKLIEKYKDKGFVF